MRFAMHASQLRAHDGHARTAVRTPRSIPITSPTTVARPTVHPACPSPAMRLRIECNLRFNRTRMRSCVLMFSSSDPVSPSTAAIGEVSTSNEGEA